MRIGSLTCSGTARSIRPAELTIAQKWQENGPLYESASHRVFFGVGGVSTCSIEITLSATGPDRNDWYQTSSAGHSSGLGMGVVGVTGVSVNCSTFGGRISAPRSRRTLAQVSTG